MCEFKTACMNTKNFYFIFFYGNKKTTAFGNSEYNTKQRWFGVFVTKKTTSIKYSTKIDTLPQFC